MEEAVLGALFVLILGAYGYTWQSLGKLWDAIDDIKDNHIAHLQQDLDDLRQRLKTPPRIEE